MDLLTSRQDQPRCIPGQNIDHQFPPLLGLWSSPHLHCLELSPVLYSITPSVLHGRLFSCAFADKKSESTSPDPPPSFLLPVFIVLSYCLSYFPLNVFHDRQSFEKMLVPMAEPGFPITSRPTTLGKVENLHAMLFLSLTDCHYRKLRYNAVHQPCFCTLTAAHRHSDDCIGSDPSSCTAPQQNTCIEVVMTESCSGASPKLKWWRTKVRRRES